jgi:phosphoribosyl 1,2-cyclic phosphodiesterase
MILTFLGTRGEIELRTRRHRRHSSLLVQRGRARVMIDCGADWLGRLGAVRPTAIVLTHAHPDHAWGLAQGAPCPVYAARETWDLISGYPIGDKRTIRPRRPVTIAGLRFEAFALEHSTRAPAVGYRVSAEHMRFFYAPDVVAIRERHDALTGIDLYIGDGATIVRSMVRRRQQALIGHTPIRTQLGWCAKEGVRAAIFTHCGSEIVGGAARTMRRAVAAFGEARGVDARIAHDGLRIVLHSGRLPS